ncbi:MAG: hypothetical protein IJX08_00450 [Clostridia bacterium]|nr:hypothetical protein [Clostridia bacterium]
MFFFFGGYRRKEKLRGACTALKKKRPLKGQHPLKDTKSFRIVFFVRALPRHPASFCKSSTKTLNELSLFPATRQFGASKVFEGGSGGTFYKKFPPEKHNPFKKIRVFPLQEYKK